MKETKGKKCSAEKEQQPVLHFFRATPRQMMDYPPLASSLQALETCFFLVALGRFPSALVACATAWESVIKAKLALVPEDGSPFDTLINQIQNVSANLRTYDRNKLHTFRKTRNRIVHFGFSPKDDEECACLLVQTGLPFLNCCYRDLFDFYLDWRDIRPDVKGFFALSSEEVAKAGLMPEVADQLRVVSRVYLRAKALCGLDLSYCFHGFGHYITNGLKIAALTTTEARILKRGDESGVKFEHESEAKAELEIIFKSLSWEFDCPICHGCNTVVGELDDVSLRSKRVSVRRCVCVSCELIVPEGTPYLADELLHAAIEKQTPLIIKEFGIQ